MSGDAIVVRSREQPRDRRFRYRRNCHARLAHEPTVGGVRLEVLPTARLAAERRGAARAERES